MNQTAGTILKRKVSAIQTRGYSFPIQSELAATLEHAAAKGATSALRVTTEAIVEHSRAGRLGTHKRNKAIRPIEPPERAFPEPLAKALAAEVAVKATGEAAHG